MPLVDTNPQDVQDGNLLQTVARNKAAAYNRKESQLCLRLVTASKMRDDLYGLRKTPTKLRHA